MGLKQQIGQCSRLYNTGIKIRGFNLPKDSILLATGDRFNNQAFKYNNCYALQFHPEVNFLLHLRWLFFVLLTNPKKLMLKGSQNIFYQLLLRIGIIMVFLIG